MTTMPSSPDWTEPPQSSSSPLNSGPPSTPPIGEDAQRPRQLWIDAYVDFASTITDAPPVFHKYSGLSIAAAALESHVYFRFGDQQMRPNLWVCVVAGSSVARKSTSISIARGVYTGAVNKPCYPDEFSQESFVDLLAGQPNGLLHSSEFINLVSCIKKEYNQGVMGFLADMYDCPKQYHRCLKSRDYYINNPSVNILAATTVEWFLGRLTEDDWAGGFVPRFLLVPFLHGSTKKMALPPPVDQKEKARITNGLRSIGRSRGELYFDDDVRAQYEQWYEKHSNRDGLPIRFLGSYHRMAVMAIKLAMVFQCMKTIVRDKAAITSESLGQATDCIDELADKLCGLVEDNLGFSKFEKERNLLITLLREYQDQNARSKMEQSMPHSVLLRRSKMPVQQFRSVMETLVESGDVETLYVYSEANRKTTVYRLKEKK